VARGPQAVKARAGQLRRRKAQRRQPRQGGRGATASAMTGPGPSKAGRAAGREARFTLTLPAGPRALGAALAGALVERLGREGAAEALEVALDRVNRPGA
jgi:hypothetical protein